MLQKSFDHADLEVVAIYIETCGGVPDHVAGVRDEVRKHGLEYRVLDGEAGKIDDPTRARFPWAPHALVVDAGGRVVETFGHMPTMEELTEDLRDLVAIGRIESRPDQGWREFKRGSWVKIRFVEDESPRVETRKLRRVSRSGVKLDVAVETVGGESNVQRTVSRERPRFDREDRERKELAPASLEIDGGKIACRVFETRWTLTKRSGRKVSFTERSWVANDSSLPEALLKRETTERRAGGGEVKWTWAVRTFVDRRTVGDHEVTCWVVERGSEWTTGSSTRTTWFSNDVPGREVRSVATTVNHGLEAKTSREAVDFGTE